MNKLRNAPVSLLSVLIVLSLLLAACPAPGTGPAAQAPAATQATTVVTDTTSAPSGDAMTTIYGTKLPDDAVPYDEQVYTVACNNTANMTTMDFSVSVYTRYCLSDLFQDTLIDLDKDFNVKPASAEKWEVAADGLTWTFHIKPGLMWSDGTPVTAHDWVATYQYEADPKHAWDFTWFYAGVIKNWDEVVAGEVPSTTLGITAVDDLSLQIVTTKPFPPLPGMMKFSFLMQKKALETYGPFYNNDPKTSVSAGPFKLESLEPGKRVVVVANEKYKGFRQPRLKSYIGIFMAPDQYFESFKKGEINEVDYESLTPADFDIIQKDPVLSKNYLRHFGDFRTDYLLFDTFNPPFNDLNVRKAFAHAIDREAIVKNVYGEIKAMPAYSMLMPGFPSSDTKSILKQYQDYDCAAAQKYLADAGFPEGKDFPALELWLRNEQPALQAVFQAVAASIADCLKVQIEVSNKDQKVYMDSLNAKPTKVVFGAISYGMDYLDPTNMLGIWVSTGRHSWKNDAFDKLIADATPLVGDAAKRDQMFRDAQKILVDDVGGVFIDHRWQGKLYQPYVQGDSVRVPDSNGISGPHWGNDWITGNLYIAKH